MQHKQPPGRDHARRWLGFSREASLLGMHAHVNTATQARTHRALAIMADWQSFTHTPHTSVRGFWVGAQRTEYVPDPNSPAGHHSDPGRAAGRRLETRRRES